MSAPVITTPLPVRGGPQPLAIQSKYGPPTVLQQIGGGAIQGFSDIPVVGWAFDNALRASGLVSDEQLQQLQAAAGAGPIGLTSELVAEWAPQLLLGGPLLAAAKRLALGAVGSLGGAAIGGVVGAQGIRAAALANATAEAAPLLQRIMGGPLAKQLADTVLIHAGEMLPLTGPPAILRAAEVLANAGIYGSITATDAVLEGKPLVESAREGALAGLLVGGVEGAFTGAAKALFPGARTIDRALVAAASRNNPLVRDFVTLARGELGVDITRAKLKMTDATREIQAFKDLAKLFGMDTAEAVLGQEHAAAQAALKAGRIELRAARGAKRAVTTALNQDAAWLPIVSGTLRGTAPIGEGTAESLMQRLLLNFAQTPEQVAKKLGPSGAKLMASIRLAEGEHATSSGVVLTDMLKIAQRAHGATGAPTKLRGGSQFLTPYVDAAQQGGSRAVARAAAAKGLTTTQADEVAGVFDDIQMMLLKAHTALRGVGVEPTKIKGGIPLVLRDDLSHETMLKKLRSAFVASGRPWEEAEQVAGAIMSKRLGRNSMFNMQDALNDQLGHLSFSQVVAAGFPIIDDPLVALQSYLSSAHRRVAYARNLGPKFEVVKVLTEAAKREGASSALVQDMANGALLRNYGDHAGRLFAAAVANLQSATKMTFSVIPNATQSVLTASMYGLRNTLRFVAPGGRARTLLPRGLTADAEVTSAGLNNSILSAYRETYLDTNMRTPLGWLADGLFTWTQFNRVEGWNRKTAAATALYDTVRTMTMMAEGRLKGQTLATAARRLEAVGLNPDKVNRALRAAMVKSGGDPDVALAAVLNANGGRVMKQVAWRGAQLTQFLPSPSRKPTFWHTPVGSVMFQFKSFALGQARFLRDAVLAEAAKGNVAPLARMLALAVPSGELVASAQAGIRRKDRDEDGLQRALADVAAVGGFGVVSDTVLAARNSRLLSFVAGPTGTDLARFAEGLVSDNANDRVWRQVSQLPAARALGWLAEPLGAATAGSLQLLRENTSPTAEAAEALTLDELRSLEIDRQP